MAAIRLAKLPDRNPVKLSIQIMPELHNDLTRYAELYASTYGVDEPVTERIPHMLRAYLQSDRSFSSDRIAKREQKK